jgi:hypothetical protein
LYCHFTVTVQRQFAVHALFEPKKLYLEKRILADAAEAQQQEESPT